jgi:hypothetical protein
MTRILYEHPEAGVILWQDGMLLTVENDDTTVKSAVPIGPLGLLELAQKLVALAVTQLEAKQ